VSALRRLGLGLGVVAILLGIAVIVEPSLAAGVDPAQAFVLLVGLAALVQGVRSVRKRVAGELDAADPPDPEDRASVSVPGRAFDELLADRPVLGRRKGRRARVSVRERLETATLGVLQRVDGDDPETARERLTDGSWTTDRLAAAFFATDDADLESAPLSDRIRRSLRAETGFQRRGRHVVTALAERLDMVVTRGIRAPSSLREQVDDPDEPGPTDRETGRWRGVGSIALLGLAGGILANQPALVLVAVVGVAFAAYATTGASPPADAVELERQVSDADPAPGDEVVVGVTVRNVSDRTLPDVRVVDGVPPTLSVPDGTPAHATALRPGESTTFTYPLRAARGQHAFEPASVLLRDWSGAVERELELEATAPTPLHCEPQLSLGESFPLRALTSGHVGQVRTDVGGSGMEFHSVREYRSGDPSNRIDWKRAARTGEFATFQFHEERSATVVLLVDAREETYVAPETDQPPAVDHSVEAAGEVFTALLAAGDKVGIAAFAPRTCWLPPGAGSGHRARAQQLLATHPALSASRPDRPFYAGVQLRRLRRRLPDHAQVVFFTPLVDDYPVSVVRRLDAYGHLVTVVSPNPTREGSPGETLAAIERSLRLSELRRAGIPVIDWQPADPLRTAIERAERRWSG
jgi:uncharacterized protein (DUF58 family)